LTLQFFLTHKVKKAQNAIELNSSSVAQLAQELISSAATTTTTTTKDWLKAGNT